MMILWVVGWEHQSRLARRFDEEFSILLQYGEFQLGHPRVEKDDEMIKIHFIQMVMCLEDCLDKTNELTENEELRRFMQAEENRIGTTLEA